MGKEVTNKNGGASKLDKEPNYIEKIEKLTREIEGEKDFDKAIKKFTEAAELVKLAMKSGEHERGKVMEIIRDIDEIIERELDDEID